SWDSPEIKGGYIFEPAGTNITENQIFAINTHGFFGYFDGLKNVKTKVKYLKPQDFYGASSTINVKNEVNFDVFSYDNYPEMVDAPIMYSKPDTTILKIGGAEILVSVYSPNQKATSKEIANNIKTLLEAQKEYLGGKLPIEKYAFLIILSDNVKESYGALEHSFSSFYFLPEGDAEELSQTIKDVCAHEFFHIITPLSIHSEEIGDFDFNEPKMSQHLWLYEGMTEYAAGHMQAKYNLVSTEKYLDMLSNKIENMFTSFDDTLPFTEMSKNVLDKHKKQYGNVYEKGALIGMCLDVKLRELSAGKYGTQDMMRDLSKFYGKNKSFKDNELFGKIIEITKQPSLKDFFVKYVSGKEPLPIKETFASVGINYQKNKITKVLSIGFSPTALDLNKESKMIYLKNIEEINETGKKLGLKQNDELVSINGKSLLLKDFSNTMKNFYKEIKNGDKIELVVNRNDENNTPKPITLQTELQEIEITINNSLEIIENPTEAQNLLMKYWLTPAN
nr:peptidase M61 [Pseudarcicella sp.]